MTLSVGLTHVYFGNDTPVPELCNAAARGEARPVPRNLCRNSGFRRSCHAVLVGRQVHRRRKVPEVGPKPESERRPGGKPPWVVLRPDTRLRLGDRDTRLPELTGTRTDAGTS